MVSKGLTVPERIFIMLVILIIVMLFADGYEAYKQGYPVGGSPAEEPAICQLSNK